MNSNQKAFLDTIAYSEGTSTITVSNNGYNVLVGSTQNHPLLFDSYADHPRILNTQLNSTAAGRYQLLERYYDAYKKMLKLPDFSPDSQDAIALQQIAESKALSDVDMGDFETAIRKCAHIWASLPGAQYGQHTNKMNDLQDYYCNVGGILTSAS